MTGIDSRGTNRIETFKELHSGIDCVACRGVFLAVVCGLCATHNNHCLGGQNCGVLVLDVAGLTQSAQQGGAVINRCQRLCALRIEHERGRHCFARMRSSIHLLLIEFGARRKSVRDQGKQLVGGTLVKELPGQRDVTSIGGIGRAQQRLDRIHISLFGIWGAEDHDWTLGQRAIDDETVELTKNGVRGV